MGFLVELPTDAEWKRSISGATREKVKQAIAYVEHAGRAANVEVESVIRQGIPVAEIIGFSERNDVDLIVMGTHGRTGIPGFLLGSVAEKVVRHSKKSVLVVRGKGTGKGK